MGSRVLLNGWAVLALAAVGLAAPDAAACGGLFCDNVTSMPVDQTGENILFIMDSDSVEAHIQIQYTGEAPRFSWVLPLTSVPTFSVGSQLLFDELLRMSVPLYGNQVSQDQCANSLGFFPGAMNDTVAVERGGAGSGSSSSGGVNVVFHDAVGAFDISVLQGGTAAEVMSWLADNNYVQLPGTEAILQEYVDETHVFAAVKLVQGTGVEEIHPLVVRYQGSVPCVPLRLTRVAAQADMGVRTFFLGDARVVPQRYKHLLVNPVRIDWVNNASNYRDVLTHAADHPAAGGQAFVTEFAGPTERMISVQSFYNPSWTSSPFTGAQPVEVVNDLTYQGLMACSGDTCSYFHPLVLPLLREYLPAPSGVTEDAFYACLSCYQQQINTAAWNGVEFAAKMDERIVQPARHANDLVAQNPYLTRMFTTISPEEMTVDPEFHERADLPDVPALRQSSQRLRCDGTSVVTLPDGREVVLRDASTWPAFDDDMPWAEIVEDIPPSGDIITMVDNKVIIDHHLARFNSRQERTSGWCVCATVSGGMTGTATLALALLALAGARRRR